MAYVSQELKKELAPKIKAICQKYGVKATLSVRNHSTLCLNIKSGKINFAQDCMRSGYDADKYIEVNHYHYQNHFCGRALQFLKEVIPAMNKGNHDNSDIHTDYFDVGWYISVSVGKWNKPYKVE